MAAFFRAPQPFTFSSILDLVAVVSGGPISISGLTGFIQEAPGYAEVGPFSSSNPAWRHVAVRAGPTQWQVFVNGVLAWSSSTYGAVTPVYTQSGLDKLQLATLEGGQFDNVVFTREALSDAAIAALAAGAMPNSSGILLAP
jgi:hypothetical protein